VCDQETSKTKAKARYRAVEIQPQWVLTPGKQTTTNNHANLTLASKIIISFWFLIRN
jgi:hypothetical protein